MEAAEAATCAKLQELIRGRPVTYRGQNIVNLPVLAVAVIGIVWLAIGPAPRSSSPQSSSPQ